MIESVELLEIAESLQTVAGQLTLDQLEMNIAKRIICRRQTAAILRNLAQRLERLAAQNIKKEGK